MAEINFPAEGSPGRMAEINCPAEMSSAGGENAEDAK